MQTTKELIKDSYEAIHKIVTQHLIENYGECDHDKHADLMVDIIWKLKDIKLEDIM
jgi:hypothetical protein